MLFYSHEEFLHGFFFFKYPYMKAIRNMVAAAVLSNFTLLVTAQTDSSQPAKPK